MRKLNQNQVEQIKKGYPKIAGFIIKYVEKIGDEKIELENDIELAIDILKERE